MAVKDGYAGLFICTGAPTPPTSLTLTDNIQSIGINFVASDTNGVQSYEIWRSENGDVDTNYSLLVVLTSAEVAARPTVKYTDYGNLMNRKGTKYYRIYSLLDGVRSSAASSNIPFPYDVDDVTGTVLKSTASTIVILYNIPKDNRLNHIEILCDAQASQGSLSLSNAVTVYQGLASEFTYKVAQASRGLWYQFWIFTVTRDNTINVYDSTGVTDVPTVVRV